MSASKKHKVTERFQLSARKLFTAYLFSIVLCVTTQTVYADDIVVAVKRGTSVTIPISRYMLSGIFGMRLTTWPDGSAIRVFVLPDEDYIHSFFCKQILHIFPHQLRTAWDRLVYSGTGQAPEVLQSEQEMRSRIANTPGAIGYLTKSTLDDTLAILPVE